MCSDFNTEPQSSNDPLGLIGWTVGGKYKINSYLGGGGFGEVYDGHNVNLPEQRLVIKFFKKVIAREKFIKEARILCMLDHPNISKVIDFLQEEGALVVAYIDGRDCAHVLRTDGPLPEKLFLSVARSIASAIAYAHERQIAHRDIKPENIMIDKNNHAYLIDFGIAKQIGGDATRTGYQALTPMFAAPERQQGDVDYNPYLSDVYELGVTMFNMVTRTMPYRNPVSPDTAEWGGTAATRLSPQLRQILRKATDPNPARRYQTVRSLLNDLENLNAVYHRKSIGKTVVIAAAAIVVIAGGYFGYQAIKGSPSPSSNSASRPTQTNTPTKTEDTLPVVPVKDSQPAIIPGNTADTSKPATDSGGVAGSAAEVPAETKSKEPEPKPEPPPQPKPKLQIQVRPTQSTQLFVDGRSWQIGRRLQSTEGTHSVEVINPNFPIHTKSIRVAGEFTEDNIDLPSLNASGDSVDINLSWNPPAENVMVNLSMNGGSRRFSHLPVLDLAKPAGLWQLDVSMIPLDNSISEIVVDSFKTWPFGNGPTEKVRGASGRLELKAPPGVSDKMSMIPLQIFWSKKR